MALNIGGKASGFSSSGTTCVTGVFTSTPSVGQKVYVGVTWFDDTPRTVTITDNATGGTNTYSPAADVVTGNGSTDAARWYVATVDRTNGAFQVTATFSGDAGNSRVSAFEVTGNPNSVDLSGGQVQNPGVTTTDGTTSGAVGTPSVDNCIVLAISRCSAGPDNFVTGTGYTGIHSIEVGGNSPTVSEYLVQTTKAPVEATFTQDSSGNTLTTVIVVTPTGGGGGGGAGLYPISARMGMGKEAVTNAGFGSPVIIGF